MSCDQAERLLQSLKVQVPGATDDMLSLQLFNVADEFFRRTNGWRTEDKLPLEEGQREYPFFMPEGSTFVRVWGVGHNGNALMPASSAGMALGAVSRVPSELTFPDADASFKPLASDIAPGGASTYAIYAPGYIALTTAPDAEAVKYPLLFSAVLSVAKGCAKTDCTGWSIPEWCWDSYFQAWLDGVLSRMYAMPAKPWTNSAQAIYHGKRFMNAKSFHKQEALRGMNFNVSAWRFPRTGGWV